MIENMQKHQHFTAAVKCGLHVHTWMFDLSVDESETSQLSDLLISFQQQNPVGDERSDLQLQHKP